MAAAVRDWVPVSTSPKGRLALAAVQAFGARSFDQVTVGELAKAAGVTTGALYHHFESKLGLYGFVRRDVERRLLDRMEGAAAADPDGGARSALIVGFDYAVSRGFARLLGDPPPPGSDADGLRALLERLARPAPLGLVLTAAWRAALRAVADGGSVVDAREAVRRLALATE